MFLKAYPGHCEHTRSDVDVGATTCTVPLRHVWTDAHTVLLINEMPADTWYWLFAHGWNSA